MVDNNLKIELERLFADGHYDHCIHQIEQFINTTGKSTVFLDNLFVRCCFSANYVDRAIYHAISMYQRLHVLDTNPDGFNMYYQYLKNKLPIQVGLHVLRETRALKRTRPDYSGLFKAKLAQIAAELQHDHRQLIVYPMIWSLAFGDMLVVHQFIKQKKQAHPDAAILLITPLNRPDLAEMTALNTAVDYVIDITLLPDQEQNRLTTISLFNGAFLNLSHQEYVTHTILDQLYALGLDVVIEKPRPFPMLDGYDYNAGWRIWEKRAALFLQEQVELPKLVEQTYDKQDKITVHFRQADYAGGDTRNVRVEQCQALINHLKEVYPGYEVVRLGDPSMTPLQNCRDLSQQAVPLELQIRQIQQSRVFIGCHSAPQHLAVACSDTPVICTHYTVSENCRDMDTQTIAKVAYEPVGKQVKAVLYNQMFDAQGRALMPHPKQDVAKLVAPQNTQILAQVAKILDR